ncbi:NAD(P)H-binding protein [Mumia sp. ZJ1417]|uniref:NAD(P)H-binding protein n=1 Tax=unclassified Mumia TaxID=2621872 RepID=UPI00141F8A74|nr:MULTISPECIES: NAD(P)H-binding protein [unclassified Mumia]QMW67639.1 NAD(P)H-binding protein [Mumia sp. ZJ1417]
MKVAIAGGHGKIALLLTRKLADAGHEVVGLIRKPEHADDVTAAGGSPVLVDLESASATQVADALGGADAAVFAAGAGSGSGVERKWTVDRDGAVLLAAAAQLVGAYRFVVVSSMGAGQGDASSDDVFQVYLAAKGEADDAVRASALDWTIVRPGGLTDDPGTGRVTVGDSVGRGSIPRADVAEVIAVALETPSTVRTTFEVVGGDVPVAEALASLSPGPLAG